MYHLCEFSAAALVTRTSAHEGDLEIDLLEQCVSVVSMHTVTALPQPIESV